MRRRGIPTWGVFTQKRYSSGGALIDIGVHVLDQTMWLMGNPKPVAVSGATYTAFGNRPEVVAEGKHWDASVFDVDDLGVGLVRFANGATLYLRASWASNIEKGFVEHKLLGTLGGAVKSPLKVYKELHGTLVDVTPVSLPDIKPNVAECAHFIACARGDTECLVVPEQVLDVQAVLDGIYESARTGREVRLEH
jgi:predicted dehydrogenase